ncbi:MAG: chlorophyll synthesis pathway protein BchC [Hyphomicrobiaceae bacterium]
MDTLAVIFEKPEQLALGRLDLSVPGDDDVVIDIAWSGISTGTERLLWSGRMPPFPGMGYPLVPGYESVGHVSAAGKACDARVGEFVFVPGARCFGDVRGLFGGAAARVVVPSARAMRLDAGMGERGVLMALAATAYHVTAANGSTQPDLIVGHGVLGRLLARIAVAQGAAPTVWESDPDRRGGADGYAVVDPTADSNRAYRCICDVSGDASILDSLVERLAPGGEIVLAGFYDKRLDFAFPLAFMREARFRIAAEWKPSDLLAVKAMIDDGRLSLDDLITHRSAAIDAASAYRTAFGDRHCLKMVLDWRHIA